MYSYVYYVCEVRAHAWQRLSCPAVVTKILCIKAALSEKEITVHNNCTIVVLYRQFYTTWLANPAFLFYQWAWGRWHIDCDCTVLQHNCKLLIKKLSPTITHPTQSWDRKWHVPAWFVKTVLHAVSPVPTLLVAETQHVYKVYSSKPVTKTERVEFPCKDLLQKEYSGWLAVQLALKPVTSARVTSEEGSLHDRVKEVDLMVEEPSKCGGPGGAA